MILLCISLVAFWLRQLVLLTPSHTLENLHFDGILMSPCSRYGLYIAAFSYRIPRNWTSKGFGGRGGLAWLVSFSHFLHTKLDWTITLISFFLPLYPSNSEPLSFLTSFTLKLATPSGCHLSFSNNPDSRAVKCWSVGKTVFSFFVSSRHDTVYRKPNILDSFLGISGIRALPCPDHRLFLYSFDSPAYHAAKSAISSWV